MSNHPELHPPIQKRILAALSPEDYERIAPHLEHVDMPSGQILYETNETIEHVYFPTGSMISLVSQLSDGSSVEVVVGFEGMAGLPIVLGVDRSPYETMVQLPNGAICLQVDVLMKEFKRGGAMHDVLLRYTQSLMSQTSQVAEFNHLLEHDSSSN